MASAVVSDAGAAAPWAHRWRLALQLDGAVPAFGAQSPGLIERFVCGAHLDGVDPMPVTADVEAVAGRKLGERQSS